VSSIDPVVTQAVLDNQTSWNVRTLIWIATTPSSLPGDRYETATAPLRRCF